MANTTLTLNNIVASKNAIIFNTSDGIFIGHNDISNVMDPVFGDYTYANKWNFNVLDTNNYMHANMYPISAFTLQSYQYKKSPALRQNDVDDFIDVYGPTSPLLKCCQYFDFSYFLTGLTLDSIAYDCLFFNPDLFATSYIQKTIMPINTYVYPSSAVITSGSNPTNMATSGESTLIPLYNLSGVQFNFIEELPLDFGYYNYEPLTTSAYYYVYADSLNAKNQYSYDYSVRSVLTSTTNTSNVSAYLTNARSYNNINTTGDILYIVYKNNMYYKTQGSISLSSNTTGITFGMVPTSSFASTGTIIDIPLTTTQVLTASPINRYDNVEVISSINRIKELSVHKSNLFSINIKNANINTASLSADDISNIKNGLTNIIESVIKNVIPVNTQLFKIYWNGQ